MTTGRGIVVVSAWRSQVARSSSSAFSLSSRTTARRTEQTLMGSNVALRTSTRPTPSSPRRGCSESGVDDTGPGGLDCMAVGKRIAGVRGALCSCRVGPEGPYLLAMRGQAGDRVGHRAVVVAPLEVDEEHVAAQPLLAWARLDLRQVHAAEGELRQAAHEPAGLAGADAPEDQGRLPRPRPPRFAGSIARQPHEARLVVGHVLDAGAED